MAPNACFYTTLAKMNFPMSMCLTTDTDFISTKLYIIRSQAQFSHFRRNTPVENVKKYILQFGIILHSSFSTLGL